MKYAYVQGWYGNGFEDAGSEVTSVKLFDRQADAIAHSGVKFLEVCGEYVDSDQLNDMTVQDIAEQLNGEVDVSTGWWEVGPESSAYGRVVKVE